jgi:hypothetical protein
MKIRFTKHTDTSLGRFKIGEVADLPTKEAKEFVKNGKATAEGKFVEEPQEIVEAVAEIPEAE